MRVPRVSEVLDRIKSYPDADTAIQYAFKNCYGPMYLVGGKVYRTLIEMMTGRDVGAKFADWDFLCMGDIKDVAPKPKGWRVSRCSYYSNRSVAIAYHAPTGAAQKIDLISMKDIMKKCSMDQSSTRIVDYLNAVPIDIQAIAIGPNLNLQMYGNRCIEAIRRNRLSVNNSDGSILPISTADYISQKAATIGFYTTQTAGIAKIPCNCFLNDAKALWAFGCQAPALHN